MIQTIVALIFFLAVGTGGYIGLNNKIGSQTDSAAFSANKLAGQLSEFISIEKGMQDAVNQGDFASATQGADNLEKQWDTEEPKLRKSDGKAWVKIDRTIDLVLAAVRSGKPDSGKSTSALTNSLKVLTIANQ